MHLEELINIMCLLLSLSELKLIKYHNNINNSHRSSTKNRLIEGHSEYKVDYLID